MQYPIPDYDKKTFAFYSQAAQKLIRNHRPWPVRGGHALTNPDPDIIPLLELRTARPPIDKSKAIQKEEVNAIDLDKGTVEYIWVNYPRPESELLAAVNGHEEILFHPKGDLTQDLIDLQVALLALTQLLDTTTLPPRLAKHIDKVKTRAAKTWHNRQTANALRKAIRKGNDFDISTADWK